MNCSLQKYIVLSFIIHLLFLFSIAVPRSIPAIKKTLNFSLKQNNERHWQQIVDTPNQEEVFIVQKDVNLLSDKNAWTPRQQVKRGDNDAPLAAPIKKQAPLAPMILDNSLQNAESEIFLSQEKLAKLEQVCVDGNCKKNINSKENSKNNAKTDSLRLEKLSAAQPWNKISSDPAFSLSIGSLDYLPAIPDGDVTLLNTKADFFATFVRRVALNVFSGIKKRNWQKLSSREISKLNDFVTVRAKMSPKGKIISADIVVSSGITAFDNLVQESVVMNGFDKNPPIEAISTIDGNIEFIFKARTWTRSNGQGFGEQRWLLLGTGLL